MSQTLAQRLARGAGVSVLSYAATQIIRLGGNLITTRLLVPELFGVMALAATLLTGMEMLSDLGIRQSVVRSKDERNDEFLGTAWTLQIVRSAIMATLFGLLTLALWFAQTQNLFPPDSAYAEPKLPLVLAFFCGSAFLRGFSSIHLFVVERQIKFTKIAIHRAVSQTFAVVVVVVWALIDPTIWALTGGAVGGTIMTVVLSHIMFPSRANRLKWNRTHVVEMLNFGKWIMVSSLFGFLSQLGDRILLGVFLTKAELGIYSIAAMLATAGVETFRSMRQAFFAALSEVVRERPERQAEAYYKIRRVLDPLLFLATGLVMSIGDTVVRFLYDPRYEDAGWMLQILALKFAVSAYTLKGMFFSAGGDSKKLATIQILTTIALFAGIWIGFSSHGVAGAIVAVAVAPLFVLPLSIYYFKAQSHLSIVKEVMFIPAIAVGYGLGELFEFTLAYYGVNFE